MKKLYSDHLDILLGELKRMEHEHPKANVYYDMEAGGIQVVYPLPKDFYKLNKERNFGDDL